MLKAISFFLLLIVLTTANSFIEGFFNSLGKDPPTLLAHPRSQIVNEYEDVVIDCIDFDQSNESSARWREPNGRPLPKNVFQDRNRLKINSIRLSQAGLYYCFNKDNTKFVTAEVHVRPRITTVGYSWNTTSRSYYVTSGIPTTPTPVYQTPRVTTTPYPCMYGVCNGTCCRKDVVEDYFDCSNGQKINKSLVCNRENDCADGSDESKCSPWPPKITVLPKHEVGVFCGDEENEKSGTLTLECQSVGHPTPVIRWKKYDGHVPSKCQQYSKGGHGILTCPNFQQSDQGAYSCVAENSVKSAESQPKSVAKCSNTINCRGFRVVNSDRIEHCLECYCSGKTSSCQGIKSNSIIKSFPFPETKSEIFVAENGEIRFIPTKSDLTPSDKIRQSAVGITYCKMSESDFEETSFLESFGRNIIIPRYKGKIDFLVKAPEIIIRGNGVSLMYTVNLISPPNGGLSYISAKFWPGNWHHINKKAASRKDLMKVLSNVDAIFLRCEYTEGEDVVWGNNATISLESSLVTEFATSVSYVEKCHCPAGYDGLSCETCAAGYKRKPHGSDFICEKIFVPPPCKPGYIGIHCNVCDTANGYIKKGDNCTKPVCHPDGSTLSTPSFITGACSCKAGVTGKFCDECSAGFFNLNKNGCQKCWCSDVTDKCESSNLYRTVISNTPRGGYNSSDGRNFWLLPQDFSGNRLTSYGGHLNYSMKYKSGLAKESAYLTVEFLSADDVTLIYTHSDIDRSTLRDEKSWSVPIVETKWKKSDRSFVSRGEFLTVLSKIKAIYIESPYHLSSGQVNLTATRMSSASSAGGYGDELALAVEQCSCPEGYTGLSCERCSEGYYKKKNGTTMQCIKCNCANCDPEFGCSDCPDLTYRDNPETEKMPICKPCPCNGNGVSCVKDDLNQIFCRCKTGYTGMHCESETPRETDNFTVFISPRKIRDKKVGTAVSVNCSFSSNEEMVLSAKKRYKTTSVPLASNFSGSTELNKESGTTKNFDVVLDNGLEAIECFVHDAKGKLAGHVVAVVEGLITITKPVKIENCYSDRIDVKESESKLLICQATGSPTPMVSWYKSVGGASPEKVDTTDGVHTIESASLKDNGTIFTCIAENEEGDKDSCTQVLIVQKKCELIHISPKVVTVEENKNVSIKCKTTAKSNVTWTLFDKFLNSERSIYSSRITVSDGYLHIYNAQESDSGIYICSATGENGKISNNASVTVEKKKIPPQAFIKEDDQVLTPSDTFTATCIGTGQPVPVLTWSKVNGTFGPNVQARGYILSIIRPEARDAGVYQCEARSTLGRSTAFISIEVEEVKIPPRVNVSEEIIRGHEGEQVTLTCLAIGYPRPKLTWFAPDFTFPSVSRVNNSMILIEPQESVKEDMTFNLTKQMDGLVVTCTAENSGGVSAKNTTIKILQSQDGVNETVEFVPIGSYFEIICDSNGELVLEKSGGFFGDECPIPNGWMIPSVQAQHNGTYMCKLKSEVKKKIHLIVVGFVPKFSNTLHSFMVMPALLKSEQIRIEMSFNPKNENGLLLRKGNRKFDIYLEKRRIHVEIYFNGGDSLNIAMNTPLQLGKWFSLVVTIDRNYVDVTVYNDKTTIYDRKTESSKDFNTSLEHGDDTFYLGGSVKQRHHKLIPYFDGCISRLSIDRHEYDIVKESSFSQNVTLCRRCSEEPNLCPEKGKCLDAPTQYGFICVCPNDEDSKGSCPQSCAGKGCETQLDLCRLLKPCNGALFNKCTNNMYSLQCNCAYGYGGTTCEKVQEYSFCANGNGFVKLPSQVLERSLGKREIIRMAFTLTKPDGQLLWQGDKSNHLSISVSNGELKYVYLNQHSKLSIVTNKLEMKKKHTLLIKRINETVTLELNEQTTGNTRELYKNSTSKYRTNRVHGDIYLGNIPNGTLHSGHHVGLHGCIHYVSFGDKSKINLSEKEIEKFNVAQNHKRYSRFYFDSDESDYSNDLESDYSQENGYVEPEHKAALTYWK